MLSFAVASVSCSGEISDLSSREHGTVAGAGLATELSTQQRGTNLTDKFLLVINSLDVSEMDIVLTLSALDL